MSALVDHYEAFLGPMHAGWSRTPTGAPIPFRLASFLNVPPDGLSVVATLGVSNVPLISERTGRELRQEFVIALRERDVDRAAGAAWLVDVGLDAVRSGRALLRGEVLHMETEIAPGSSMRSLYAAPPILFPAGFAQVRTASFDIAICWLLPITPGEVRIVAEEGWQRLEASFDEGDVDLTDMLRHDP